MAELDGEAVWLLADEFDNASLVAALEALWRSPERRRRIGERGRDIVLRENSPEVCAQHYVDAIEYFHDQAKVSRRALIRAVAAQQAQPVAKPLSDGELMSVAAGIAASLPPPRPARRLFLDVTGTRRNDLKTGIERVVRSLLLALMDAPPSGWRAEPVYLDHGQGAWHYRYARHYSLDLLGCRAETLCDDERVEPECGDVLVVLDLSGNVLVQAVESGLLVHWRNVGVAVFSVVYDLLPVQMPQMFPPGADLMHSKWLHAISSFDGALAISRAVAADLASWQRSEGIDWTARRPFRIGSFRLGADVAGSASSRGLPADAAWMLQELRLRPSLLMVGTIEPRKGYMQVLEAFAELWGEGVDVNLVIVGREGWQGVPDSMRRGIPELIQRLRGHPERGRRLFWLESVSDEYLQQLYAAAHGLLAASYGEGFGLPLIEAAKHKLPVLARDLPVFREVAGEDAFYFRGWAARELADAVKVWLSTGARAPAAEGGRLTTWKQAADEFASIVTCPRAQARAEPGTRMESGE
jgi:glycosyltransferase involved in cell wall biosynthesis